MFYSKNDDTVVQIHGEGDYPTSVFAPSGSINESVLSCTNYSMENDRKVDVTNPVRFGDQYPMVRIFGDIYLVHDKSTEH